MGAADLLAQLSALGVRVALEGGDAIRVSPRSALTDETRQLIRAHKPELLASLRQSQPEQSESGTDWLLIDSGQVFRLPHAKPKTRSELLEKHPGSFLLRLPDAAQARELTALVTRVGARESFSHDEISEALERALRDPDTALECFRALVRESHS